MIPRKMQRFSARIVLNPFAPDGDPTIDDDPSMTTSSQPMVGWRGSRCADA
jgi:hypothetical protein